MKILDLFKRVKIQTLEKKSDNEIYGFGNKNPNESITIPNVKELIMNECCLSPFYGKQVDEILNKMLNENKGFIKF